MQIPKQKFLITAPLALGLLFLTMAMVMSCSESKNTPAEAKSDSPNIVTPTEGAKSNPAVAASRCKVCPEYWPANDVTMHRIFSVSRPNHAPTTSRYSVVLRKQGADFFLVINKDGNPVYNIKLRSDLPPIGGEGPCWMGGNCPAYSPFTNKDELRVLTVGQQCADQAGYEVYLRRERPQGASKYEVRLEIIEDKKGTKSSEDVGLDPKIPPEVGS